MRVLDCGIQQSLTTDRPNCSAFRMQKLLLTLGCVALTQAAVPGPRINCQECIDEMHSLSWIIKNSAGDIEVTIDPLPS